MNRKWWFLFILIILNIVAVYIGLYLDNDIFMRRFKEFVYVVDIISIPFIVVFFII
ncbi:Uncharacterised protein [Enterobacter hormaechei]|uniref:Uncharacterized protein n=1 Tax=Enterobacter cloacae TaxID=550 RepID=A0A145X7H9_ENTCL|nr:Uncharacterised protein [Enterobacter cloacae]CZZ49600.1 Uncharacterised protein [Enterobacter hormaechei]